MPQSGNDIEYSLMISPQEASDGIIVQFDYEAEKSCNSCNGTGDRAGQFSQLCPKCNGRGGVQGNSFVLSNRTCDLCGNVASKKEACQHCRGAGHITGVRTIRIKIPPGTTPGSRLRVRGKGHEWMKGYTPSDLYILVEHSSNKAFYRNYQIIDSQADLFQREAGGHYKVSNYGYAIASEDMFEYLIEATHPDLFRVNAFRLLGLSTRANERDIKKQSEKLKMMEKFGAAIQTSGPLPLDPPPNKDTIQEAIQRLRSPEHRLIDEFFWFWSKASEENPKIDLALAALANRDIKTAADIWNGQKYLGDNQGIAIHNLAVLYHTAALDIEYMAQSSQLSERIKILRDSYWREGFSNWKQLLENDEFWKGLEARIIELDDPRLTTYLAQQMRTTLPVALLSINIQLAIGATEQKAVGEVERQRQLIQASGFPPCSIEEATHRGIKPLRTQIRTICEIADRESRAEPQQSDAITRRLLQQARPMLVTVDSLLPARDYALRDDVRDEVAQTAYNCGVCYGKTTQNWNTFQELLELTRPYAISASLREIITEGIEIAKRNLEAKDYLNCWFCKENEGVIKYECDVPMYGNVTRTWVGNGTRVDWQKTKVHVPRCERCWAVHRRITRLHTRAALLSLLVGPILLFLIFITIGSFGEVFDGLTFIGSMFLIIAPIIIGQSMAATLSAISNPKIVQSANIKVKHPLVLKMISQGWRVGERPA